MLKLIKIKFFKSGTPEASQSSAVQHGSTEEEEPHSFSTVASPATASDEVSSPPSPSPVLADGRFNKLRRNEIQSMLDSNICSIKVADDKHVNQVVLNGKVIALQCDFCSGLFSHKTGSSMKSHIERCAARTLNQVNYRMSSVEKNEVNLLLAELVAMDSKSFSMTQTESFKSYTQYCINLGFKVGRHLPQFKEPLHIIPSRNTIRNKVYKEVEQLMGQFKELILKNSKFRCAVILDFTSLKYNYCGIVLHFMHQWTLKSVLVAVLDCTGISSTSANIEQIARETLAVYGITWPDNFIITDEGANVVAAFGSDSSAICIPHTINTVVKRTTCPYKQSGRNQTDVILDLTVYSKVTTFNDLLKKLKIIINCIKHSFKTYSLLQHPLVSDCDTRWLSKLTMIEAWLKLSDADKQVLSDYFANDAAKTAILEELFQGQGDLQNYILVMGIFRPSLRLLESENKPTLNHVLICYYKIRAHLITYITSNNELVKSLAVSCLAVLDRKKPNFTHDIHYVACCLDIFQRGQIFVQGGQDEVQKAKEVVENLFVQFVTKMNVNIPENVAADTYDEFAMEPGNDTSNSNQQASENAARLELQMYWSYRPSPEQIEARDILQFWSEAAAHFPLLSKYAAFILAIPASSASIERIFSVLTKTVTKDRRSLDACTVADLLMLKSMKISDLF
uniref:HAT C-terminal dimerisation domain-containing protein n=1 Tax=Panagrolaimus davidi TaxID=227884 RepID=A0A914PPH1_9BILA